MIPKLSQKGSPGEGYFDNISVRQALQTELVTLNLGFLFYEQIFKTNKNGSTSPAPALRGGPSTRPHKNKPTRKPSKPPELIFP